MRNAIRPMLLGAAIAFCFGGVGEILLAQGGPGGAQPCTSVNCDSGAGAVCTPKLCYSCSCDPSPPGAPNPQYCHATYTCYIP
jgi:hypothetical protein